MANNTLGLNQTFPIYNADGTAFHDLVIHQSSVESTVMSLGDKISGDVFYKDNTLVVTMGEYIVFDGIKYVLVNPPTIVRNGMVSDNNGTNGMTKYSFVFYHPMYMLGNFPFSDIAVTSDEQRYLSENKNFSWIGNLFDFIAKLNKNLEQTDWYVAHNIARYDNNDEKTSEWQKASKMSDVLSFDKQFVSDALKTAYDTWEIPFVAIHQKKDYEKNLYRYSNDGENFTGVSPTELAQVPTTGRNLILKSNVLHSGSDYLLCSYDFGNLKIQEGQLVNITIHGTLGSDRYYFRVYNTTASCLIKTMNAATEIESYRTWSGNVNWTKIDSRGQEVANDKLLIYQYPSSGSSVSSIEWIKVEIGTTRTEYTVAPEEYLIGTIEGKYMGYKARTDHDKQVVWGFYSYIWTYNKPFGIVFGLPNQEILDSNGNPFVFRFGKGVGLKNNSRTPRNNKIVTRIVGYGSERNIPYGYPQIPWYGNHDWSYTINNDPNEPNSLPIYDGILGGQSVRLIKHPFTRTTLMPSIYSELLFDKVSPYLSDGTAYPYYDPTTELIDYYDADNSYPNPIVQDAPSVEIHQFEDIYPELGEANIVDAVPYDQDGEYYTYAQWYAYLQGRINDMQERGVGGWQMELIQTMFTETCPLEPEEVDEHPSVIIEAIHWECNTGQATATLDVTIKGNFVYVKLVSSWYNEEHKVVQLHADPTPVWDDTMNDDGEYIQSYFEITLPQLSFDLYACAAITEEMKINMRGGACKGCTFPVAVDWDDYKKNFYKDDGTFDPVIHTTQGDGHVRDGSKFPDSRQGQITILVKKEIETFGTLMPNVYQQPKTGDAFVILGISLPQSYVEDAQWRLDEAMQEYMLENNVHYYDYPLTFDEHFLATHTDILAQMHNNSIVRFQYAGIEMALYIKQMNIKFGQKVLPEYEITLTDDVEIVLNKIGQVTDDVSRMRVQVSELQKYYSENLIEAINSKLSRTIDDVCQGRITFQQGLDAIGSVIFHDKLQSPQFVEGLYRGSGWRVDNLGNAEFESLRIRSFLEVVELLVNRMQAQEGDTIFTDNDQIEKIDADGDYYILTLKEKYQGYVTTQTEGNVIKGIINTLAAKEAGISPYSDNVLYFTSWMHVEETHTTPNSTLGVNQIRVSLYGDNDVPSGKNYLPCELMTIARWGNTLNPDASGISADEKARRKRLRSTFYISTSEGRIAKLIDVNAPKLVETNYGTTLGELPDFVKAYSSVAPRLQEGRDYLYAQGVVVEDFIKITRQGNPVYEYVDCGEWIDGSSGTPSVGQGIYLFQEFNSVTGQYETHDVWHNNAKWRAKMHQPVTIGGVSTYYEPSDTNTAYWEKLEEALQGTSYDVVWTDAFGVITNIPCDANGFVKYKTGGGVATWLTASLYKRVGNNTPTLLNVASIVLHAYNVSGSEVSRFPRTASNTSSISLNNYETYESTHVRYVVEFKDAQNNVIASSSIARNFDGTDADVWTIGQDGYWYKNGVKQNTKAEGEDGTGIELQGSVDVVLNSDISGSQTSLEGVTGMQVGDCYMVIANGWLYFYDGTTPASAGSIDIPKNPQGWKPVGKIKGEPGQDGVTYYYHIAYADGITISGGVVTATGFTTTKVKDAYAWMGICTDTNTTDPQTPQSYEWNFVQGDSITKQSESYRYATNTTGIRPNASSSDWVTTKPTLQQGYWLFTETTIHWSDGSTTVLYTDERNPLDGARGKTGRWIYFGKEFDKTNTTDTFVVSDVQIPYFKTGNNSYHAFDYGVNGAYTMAQMYAIQPNFNNAPWSVMTNDFDYLITKAIFTPNATLGSFVINGDWMLSTNGKINGVAYNNGALYNGSPAYTWFDPQYPNESVNTTHSVNGIEWTGYNFVPNYAVDGLTGKTYQHDGYFDGTIKSANAEITGTVTANEGKIGPFDIGSGGLKVGDADNWKTTNNNFAYMHESALRIGQVERYNDNDIAWIKVLFGRESDPNINNEQFFCDTAMYAYRRMVAAHNEYEPAAKIYSDNAGNINVAMRLKGALQVQGGGVIEQGHYLEYDDANNRLGLNLTYGTTYVLKNTNSSQYVWFQLPTLTQVLTQFGMVSGTKFAIPVTISAHLNSYGFYLISPPNVYMRDNDGNIINQTTISGEGQCSRLTFAKCDTVRLILISDGSTYYVQSAGRFT